MYWRVQIKKKEIRIVTRNSGIFSCFNKMRKDDKLIRIKKCNDESHVHRTEQSKFYKKYENCNFIVSTQF